MQVVELGGVAEVKRVRRIKRVGIRHFHLDRLAALQRLVGGWCLVVSGRWLVMSGWLVGGWWLVVASWWKLAVAAASEWGQLIVYKMQSPNVPPP